MTDLDELSYPIGRFSPPAASLHGIRAAHIETLRQLSERLCAVTAGLNDIQLDTPYREGGWTAPTLIFASSWPSPKIGPPSSPTIRPPGPTWPIAAGCPSAAPWQSSRGCMSAGLRCSNPSPKRTSIRATTTLRVAGKPWQRCWLCTPGMRAITPRTSPVCALGRAGRASDDRR
jgi:hypothetical protein